MTKKVQNKSKATRILKYSPETLQECCELLAQGKLVAMPTETVYGLGANALDADACKSIFTTKGRPLTDPLIVHVHSIEQALSLVDQKQGNSTQILDIFQQLAKSFWPGPLTIVVKANLEVIPELITAGTGYVGLRMPNNEIALNLLKTSGLPIAAPSANKFGHVSPSKAEHVYNDFYHDSEVAILDGGACSFGIESTVLKLSELPEIGENHFELCILRKGGVSEKQLNETILKAEKLNNYHINICAKKFKDFKKETENLEGPGQFLRHYAPNIDTYLFSGKFKEQNLDLHLDSSVLIDFGGIHSSFRDQVMHYIDLSDRGSTVEAIGNIYEALRWAETRDDAKSVLISDLMQFIQIIQQKTDEGNMEHLDALFDRIYRATSGKSA